VVKATDFFIMFVDDVLQISEGKDLETKILT